MALFSALRKKKMAGLKLPIPWKVGLPKVSPKALVLKSRNGLISPPNGTSARVKGRIIGGGSHEYLLKASAGQTLTLSVSEGALPFIFIPNDPNRQTDLTGGGHYTGLDNWSGTLPTTGDYLLVLDSNFRGFSYDFLVEVK